MVTVIEKTIYDPKFNYGYIAVCSNTSRTQPFYTKKELTAKGKEKEKNKFANRWSLDETFITIVDGERKKIYHSENDEPAYEKFVDGKPLIKEWWHMGKRHRANGLPACIEYDNNGNIIAQLHYVEGVLLS